MAGAALTTDPGRRSTQERMSRRLRREELPGWPLALPFVGYGAGWVLGLGDLVWPLCALIMLGLLIRTRDVRVPTGFGMWLLFLGWMLASGVHVDSAGRMLGFGYRAALYAGATVIAVYAFNAARSVTLRHVCGVMVVFLAVMTVFGLAALAFPLLRIDTPLSYVVPGGLRSNQMVQEMVVRRLTQYNPDSWEQTVPRPSAPFLYTNTWGNVYSLVLPLALLYVTMVRRTRRAAAAAAVCALSVVPALLTLNRGMFVGLGVVALFVAVHGIRWGRAGRAVGLLAVVGVAAVVTLLSPVGTRLRERVSTGSSTEDRLELYRSTVSVALESPLLGHGAPRPAEFSWLPALGTQGQLWTVLFSHGLVAVMLFLAWFVRSLVPAWRRGDRGAAVLGGVVLATVVESLFYGMMTGLNISLLASVLLFRPSPPDEGTEASRRPFQVKRR